MDDDLKMYIFMSISESCFKILEQDKDNYTSFDNYNSWCNYVETILKTHTSDKGLILHDFFKIIKDLTSIYGLTISEAAIYVDEFFTDGIWKNYMLLTKYRREHFGKFFL